MEPLPEAERERRRTESERLTMQVRSDLAVELDQMMTKARISKATLFIVHNPDFAYELAFARRPPSGDGVHLVLSSELLNVLSRDEVIAVLGHEIAHLAANDICSPKSRRDKELQADNIGSEISGRPRSLASALPKIDRFLGDYKNAYLDDALPGLLAKRGSLRRTITEGILRTAARATGYLTKSNYPTTNERISRLANLEDRLSPSGHNCEPYADYLGRKLSLIADDSEETTGQREVVDTAHVQSVERRATRIEQSRDQTQPYLGRN